ncbi:hypothetical protein BDQ12DRAFT_738281, partial [Crucibulum laeve]
MRFFSVITTALCAIPLVPAIVLQVPTNPTPGGETDIFWTTGPNDPPSWTLFLVNATIFLSLYQSWQPPQIDPASGHLQTTFSTSIPIGTHYQLRAVQNDNVDFVLAFSPEFNFV